MSKLTAPAPQNARRRTYFMMDHPEHPKAKRWMDFISLKLGISAVMKFRSMSRRIKDLKLEDVTQNMFTQFFGRRKPNDKSA